MIFGRAVWATLSHFRLKLVLKIQVWMLFPVGGSVFQRGNEPVAVLCVPPSLTLFVFFPPLFSHLICSSFCWTLLGPSPPSLPLSPPTTSQCIPHSLPPPLLLFPSFIIPPSATRPGSSLPWVSKFTASWKTVQDRGLDCARLRHVLQAVCIQEVHMLMEPIYLCEKFILVRQHSWQVKLLPCRPETHKRVNRQRDQIDLPEWKSLI